MSWSECSALLNKDRQYTHAPFVPTFFVRIVLQNQRAAMLNFSNFFFFDFDVLVYLFKIRRIYEAQKTKC